jgi:hypothetical protein
MFLGVLVPQSSPVQQSHPHHNGPPILNSPKTAGPSPRWWAAIEALIHQAIKSP